MAHSDDQRSQALSHGSPGLPSAPTRSTLPAPQLSEPDLARIFARLAVVYGDTRITNAAVEKLLMREWIAAIGWYAPARIHDAVSAWIKTGKFWPTPAEILEIIRADNPLPPRHPPSPPSAAEAYCREGRTVEQERAHREAFMAEMRKQYPMLFVRKDEPERESRPPSQDGLSPEFIAHAKRQGLYSGSDAT